MFECNRCALPTSLVLVVTLCFCQAAHGQNTQSQTGARDWNFNLSESLWKDQIVRKTSLTIGNQPPVKSETTQSLWTSITGLAFESSTNRFNVTTVVRRVRYAIVLPGSEEVVFDLALDDEEEDAPDTLPFVRKDMEEVLGLRGYFFVSKNGDVSDVTLIKNRDRSSGGRGLNAGLPSLDAITGNSSRQPASRFQAQLERRFKLVDQGNAWEVQETYLSGDKNLGWQVDITWQCNAKGMIDASTEEIALQCKQITLTMPSEDIGEMSAPIPMTLISGTGTIHFDHSVGQIAAFTKEIEFSGEITLNNKSLPSGSIVARVECDWSHSAENQILQRPVQRPVSVPSSPMSTGNVNP
ncbi:hypothetical protein Pan97_22740 [Bremerella volcania]|uniref:Secreted protein n=1 Tax=Bremerella volcania TaxID=2527984 RepID=A0A518C7P3_9BACT|nr:hypothetical protein [Bremerella volcania]QDU75245.1 hypothetical protein Pan97_22740 [Bremerella volcania]